MFKKILACLDGSKLAEQILHCVLELALHFNSQVVLLYVIAPTDLPTASGIGTRGLIEKQVRAEAEVKAYLHGLAEKLLREHGLWVEIATEKGAAEKTIINYGTRNAVNLIAIATHGEGGLKRLVFGSVADFVLRNSSIPVLVIRPVVRDM